LLPSRGIFACELQTLALHGINGGSAGNDPLMDEESTREVDILLRIKSTETRNPSTERDSAGNNQSMEAVSDQQDQNAQKILQRITISG
jgi:hypothetical protein